MGRACFFEVVLHIFYTDAERNTLEEDLAASLDCYGVLATKFNVPWIKEAYQLAIPKA
jgi:hypothetical protein